MTTMGWMTTAAMEWSRLDMRPIVYAMDGRASEGQCPESFRAQNIMSEFQIADTGLVTLLEFGSF